MVKYIKTIMVTLILIGPASCGSNSDSELAANGKGGNGKACKDPDGDGWGWDGKKSCKVAKATKGKNGKQGKQANVGKKPGKKIAVKARVKKMRKKKGNKLALNGFSLANTNGETRVTPYNQEQGGKGTCGEFRKYDSDPKKWVAISEPLAKNYLGFSGCTSHGTEKAPSCQSQAFAAGICGKVIKIKCTSDKCGDKGWKEVKIVDICPADRTYHRIHDPGSDDVCAHQNIVDIDENLWNSIKAPGQGINNVGIEIEIP